MSDTEATNAAAATNEEEKKHDVDYADEEAKNAVSINPTETEPVEKSENRIRDKHEWGIGNCTLVTFCLFCFDALNFGLFFCFVRRRKASTRYSIFDPLLTLDYRSICPRWHLRPGRRTSSASWRSEPSCSDGVTSNGKRGALATPSSCETESKSRFDSLWDKKRRSNLSQTSLVSLETDKMADFFGIALLAENLLWLTGCILILIYFWCSSLSSTLMRAQAHA